MQKDNTKKVKPG